MDRFSNKFDHILIFRQTWQVQTCKIFHFLENHETGDLVQERFKSTLPMSYPVDYHVITLGSSMDGLQQVWRLFDFFVKIDRSGPVKFFTFGTNHETRYPAPECFNPTEPMSGPFSWCMFTTLRKYDIHSFLTMVGHFLIFRQIWQVRTCKIFHFLENHGMGDLE